MKVSVDEKQGAFVAVMPVIAFQRCLYLLLEAIWFRLAPVERDVTLYIQVLDRSDEASHNQPAASSRYILRSNVW